MAVTVRCQHCGQRYSVREDLLGKQIKCKACSQTMTIAAEPAAAKAAAPKAAAPKQAPAAAAKPPGARPVAKPVGAPKPGAAVAQAKPRAATAAGAPRAPAAAKAQQAQAAQAAPAVDPLAAGPPTNDPLFGPSTNFLDLLGDASLPAAGAAPLGSATVLKGHKPSSAVAGKPAAKKKKKKKKGSGGASIQTQTTLRMMGGVCVILLGLGVFGLAIAKATSDDESGLHVWRAIRLSMLGFSLVGGGVKLIVG